MTQKTFTTYEIAKFCDVYPSSVIHWINAGKLKAYTTPGKHHRVTREDLIAFLKEFRIPIPPEVSPPQKKILIVEDDLEMAEVMRKAFAKHPTLFSPEVCHDGIEALIRIGQVIPELVVLDIVLPKMDGLKVCQILRSKPETRGIKVVIVTGKRLPVNENKLEEHGIDSFLRKPLEVAELLAKAAELLKVGLVERMILQ